MNQLLIMLTPEDRVLENSREVKQYQKYFVASLDLVGRDSLRPEFLETCFE